MHVFRHATANICSQSSYFYWNYQSVASMAIISTMLTNNKKKTNQKPTLGTSFEEAETKNEAVCYLLEKV